MKYEIAKTIGEEILEKIKPYVIKGKIAGSIRRKKPEVHDIDLVIIPIGEFMMMEGIKKILRSYGIIEMEGSQIIRVQGKNDEVIDCYIANDKSYEVLVLIRTGSAHHNIQLAKRSLSLGMKLDFSKGLIDRNSGKVIANTEKSIFSALNMTYVEPENRN